MSISFGKQHSSRFYTFRSKTESLGNGAVWACNYKWMEAISLSLPLSWSASELSEYIFKKKEISFFFFFTEQQVSPCFCFSLQLMTQLTGIKACLSPLPPTLFSFEPMSIKILASPLQKPAILSNPDLHLLLVPTASGCSFCLPCWFFFSKYAWLSPPASCLFSLSTHCLFHLIWSSGFKHLP